MKKVFFIFLIFLMVFNFMPIVQKAKADTAWDTDPYLWYLKEIKKYQLNKDDLNGKGIKIMIIENGGLDINHPEFTDLMKENRIFGKDTATGSTSLNDILPAPNQQGVGPDFHGTMTSAYAVGKTLGIAPGATLYYAKLDGNPDNYLKALDWAIQEKVDIVSSSIFFKNNYDPPGLQDEINLVHQNNIALVSSAADSLSTEVKNPDGTLNDMPIIPGEKDNVITVGGVEQLSDGTLTRSTGWSQPCPYDSNQTCSEESGPNHSTDFVSAGTNTKKAAASVYGAGDYVDTPTSGTSTATPLVAGILALYKEQFPKATPDELIQMAKDNAESLKGYNGGGLDSNGTLVTTYLQNWEYGYGFARTHEYMIDPLPNETVTLESDQKSYNEYVQDSNYTIIKKGEYPVTKKFLWDKDLNDYLWKQIQIDDGSKWIRTDEIAKNLIDDRNTGIHFNGMNQYGTAQVNINADVMPTVTMEFWAKPEATTNRNRQDVVGHDFWGFGRAVTVEGTDGNWGVFTGHGVWEPTAVESNQWQHIAVTYTPNDIIFKKTFNGQTQTYSFHQMTGDTPSISPGRNFVSFGRNDQWGEYYTGFLSDVRIWNRELSDSELDQPLMGNESGLVAEWKLNETNGTTGHETVTGNDASFYNGPQWFNTYSINSSQYHLLYDTNKADIQARVGDVDNFGFGFPIGYDPFSGLDVPTSHPYPFYPSANDTDGTDRIMVPSSFNYNHPATCQNGIVCTDGYTNTTQGTDNAVRPIDITYDLKGKTINSAKIQLFIDDIQAADPIVQSHFAFTLNGVEIPTASDVINALNQTGPKGKLITIDIPQEDLYLLNNSDAQIKIDDTTTGIGDAYAIDFAQLLINPK